MINYVEPTSVTLNTGSIGVGKKRSNGTYAFGFYGPSTSEFRFFKNLYMSRLNEQMKTTVPLSMQNAKVPGRAYTFKEGGFTLVSDDQFPEGSTTAVSEKLGIVNENFELRKSQGEMVGSPYGRTGVTIRTYPGVKPATPPVLVGSYGLRWKDLFQVTEIYNERSYLVVEGNTDMVLLSDANAVVLGWRRYTCTETVVNMPPISNSDIMAQLNAPMKKNVGLITSTLAASNAKALDILTLLAEMPETAMSVLQGFKVLARLFKDVKHKNFVLTKAAAKRKAYLKKKLESDLATINRKRKGASKREEILLKRAEKRALDTYANMQKESAKELGDAIASVWMNFRYNIMPNVYAIEDILSIVENFKPIYFTERDKFVDKLSITAGGRTYDVPVTHRVMIKRKFKPSGSFAKNLQRNLSADIFTTSWELIPLSFVIDWFVNVGDLLGSLCRPSGDFEELCTYSTKLSVNLDLIFENGSRITVNGFIYDRDVIDPLDYVGLVFSPDLNWMRYADIAALIWPPIRDLLIRSKKG